MEINSKYGCHNELFMTEEWESRDDPGYLTAVARIPGGC